MKGSFFDSDGTAHGLTCRRSRGLAACRANGSPFVKNAASRLYWSHVWGAGCEAAWDLIFARARVAEAAPRSGLQVPCRLSASATTRGRLPASRAL